MENVTERKCVHCGITYPSERLLFKCDATRCEDEGCGHETQCGLCLLLRIPPGASVNMDVLLNIL